MHSPTNSPIKAENDQSQDGGEASLQARLSGLSPAQKELLKKKLAQRKQVAAKSAKAAGGQDASAAIAIVGMGCRFPGAGNLEEYWDLIESGRSAVDRVPAERWSRQQFFDPTGRSPGKMSVDRMGAVAGHDQFDPAFFGIAPREASRMDPQQRLLLEVAWETYENAGIRLDKAAGTNTGVFVGIGGTDYSKVPSQYPNYYETIDAHIGTGNALSIASARISYLFDFKGPSFIVDTACSSALVAIHQAILSLRQGESDAALAGGVNMILTPETTIAFSKARMLSPDGECRPFDDDAAGYVRGEGCGLVLLKRLQDAKASGDEILGVIRGSAINQDGRTSGITAPNARSQVRVIRSALEMAGLSIDEIDYIEAHGTGTPLGDPIELTALAEVFAKRNSSQPPVRVGSVKANIGHTETASGIAGLLKVLQMFQKNRIPAQANFKRLNTNIQLPASVVQIAKESGPLAVRGRPVYAGVSSFGFGGTNAHLVVESYAAAAPTPLAKETASSSTLLTQPAILPLSATDPAALAELAWRYSDHLDEASVEVLNDVCGAVAKHRAALPLRAAFVATDSSDLTHQLRSFAEQSRSAEPFSADTIQLQSAGHLSGRKPAGRRPRVAMLFTGQGSQHIEMGRKLYDSLPPFREALDACHAELTDHLPVPLLSILDGSSGHDAAIDDTRFTQPAICAIECAIADTLQEFGIRPDVIAGHSIGEIAALYAAGAMSRPDALRLAAVRGRVMGNLPAGGAMAAILTGEKTVADWIREKNSQAVIATMNGPSAVVVAGTFEQVEALVKHAEANEVVTRRLAVSHAFHSPFMEPACDRLRSELATFLPTIKLPATMTFLSSVTGEKHHGAVDVDYWLEHMIRPVRFFDVIKGLSDQKIDLAIEVGPSPQLTAMIRRAARTNQETVNYSVVPTLDPKSEDGAVFFRSVAAAWCIGAEVDWQKLLGSSPRTGQPVRLPNYPFQRSRFWLEPEAIGSRSAMSAGLSGDVGLHPWLGSKQSLMDGSLVFTSTIRSTDPNYIADHVVSGSVIVPGAAWIETIRAAAAEHFPDGCVIDDLRIEHAVFLEDDQAVSVQCRVVGGSHLAKIEVACRLPGDNDTAADAWQVCATAKARAATLNPLHCIAGPQDGRSVDANELYEQLAQRDLEYGDFFRTVGDIRADQHAASATLTLAEPLRSDAEWYCLHPTLLDGCFHLFAAVDPSEQRTFLPVGVKKIQLAAVDRSGSRLPARAVVRRHTLEKVGETFLADVQLFDEMGHPIALLSDVCMQSLQRGSGGGVIDPANWNFELVWTPIADSGPTGSEVIEPVANETAVWTIQPFVSPEGVDLFQRSLAATQSFLAFVQQAIVADSGENHLVVVSGGHRVTDGDSVDPVSAAVLAMARVAANEHPALGLRVLDLPAGYFDEPGNLRSQLLGKFVQLVGHETEMAYRHGVFFQGRMTATGRAIQRTHSALSVPKTGNYRIRLDGTNRIEGLLSERVLPTRPQPDEVALDVFASGINFSDVLKAMGLYPGLRSDEATPMGIEVCGRVTEVGDKVNGFAIGDRVMGVVPYGFATADATKDHLLAKVPERMSDEEAASIPIVFLTAHHALLHVGRLCQDESVLIHAGAGGVGMAAIQVARSVGAEVFATAGSPTKRSLLRELGVPAQNIFSSRDIASIDQIREKTGGRGVDVVLNSLPGDWIDASLRLLAAHGRFLEIGKTDIYQDRPMGLAPFQDNLSYSAIDLDRYLRERPAQVRRLFAEVIEQFEKGVYHPSVITSFRLEELPNALRFMVARKNTGKIIVCPPRFVSDPAASTKTHLITGGSGAIAHGLAKRLVERGATSLALVARRPVTDAVKSLQAWANDRGVRIHYLQADCADVESMKAALATLPAKVSSIGAIFHLAGVLDDGLLHQMSPEALEKVLRPKVLGAITLAEIAADHPVDHLILTGSVATVLGSPGQANYAAANGFLDGFAAQRRRHGQGCVVVHFGPWAAAKHNFIDGQVAQGGMADDKARNANLAARGLTPLDFDVAVDQLIDAMDHSINHSPILVDADFGKMLTALDHEGTPSLLKGLKSSSKDSANATKASAKDEVFLARLANHAADEKLESLKQYFAQQLGLILSLSADSLDPDEPLAAFGLDSLMAIELKNSIESKLDVSIPISKFINDPTLSSLAEAVTGQLTAATEP